MIGKEIGKYSQCKMDVLVDVFNGCRAGLKPGQVNPYNYSGKWVIISPGHMAHQAPNKQMKLDTPVCI